MPPTVHRVLRRQADNAHHESAIGRTTPPTAWIFPGYAAGTHRSPAALLWREAATAREHLSQALTPDGQPYDLFGVVLEVLAQGGMHITLA